MAKITDVLIHPNPTQAAPKFWVRLDDSTVYHGNMVSGGVAFSSSTVTAKSKLNSGYLSINCPDVIGRPMGQAVVNLLRGNLPKIDASLTQARVDDIKRLSRLCIAICCESRLDCSGTSLPGALLSRANDNLQAPNPAAAIATSANPLPSPKKKLSVVVGKNSSVYSF